MKFCPLFTGCAVVVVAYRSASVVGVLTKEKLRHYLAFECAIREIAAVSDRHCLATDNPRTSVATISLSLSGPDLRALFVPSRLSRASPRFVIHTTLSRALYAACTYTNTLPANCVLVSFVPYERPFQYPLPTRAKIPFTRENWPFARTSATCSLSSIHHFHDYSDYSDYLCLLLLLILRLLGFSWNEITFPSVSLKRKADRCSRVFWL